MKVDLIAYDFDGVMTDNTVMVYSNGYEAIKCHRDDGLAVQMFRELGVPQVIVSMENNGAVSARARKLKIPCYQDIKDKALFMRAYCRSNNYDLSRVVFVGNGVPDIGVMEAVGYPVCPMDACSDVLAIQPMMLYAEGGQGVVMCLYNKIAGLLE